MVVGAATATPRPAVPPGAMLLATGAGLCVSEAFAGVPPNDSDSILFPVL